MAGAIAGRALRAGRGLGGHGVGVAMPDPHRVPRGRGSHRGTRRDEERGRPSPRGSTPSPAAPRHPATAASPCPHRGHRATGPTGASVSPPHAAAAGPESGGHGGHHRQPHSRAVPRRPGCCPPAPPWRHGLTTELPSARRHIGGWLWGSRSPSQPWRWHASRKTFHNRGRQRMPERPGAGVSEGWGAGSCPSAVGVPAVPAPSQGCRWVPAPGRRCRWVPALGVGGPRRGWIQHIPNLGCIRGAGSVTAATRRGPGTAQPPTAGLGDAAAPVPAVPGLGRWARRVRLRLRLLVIY